MTWVHIQCNDPYRDYGFDLPGVPRSGDYIEVGDDTYVVRAITWRTKADAAVLVHVDRVTE